MELIFHFELAVVRVLKITPCHKHWTIKLHYNEIRGLDVSRFNVVALTCDCYDFIYDRKCTRIAMYWFCVVASMIKRFSVINSLLLSLQMGNFLYSTLATICRSNMSLIYHFLTIRSEPILAIYLFCRLISLQTLVTNQSNSSTTVRNSIWKGLSSDWTPTKMQMDWTFKDKLFRRKFHFVNSECVCQSLFDMEKWYILTIH